ncbi:hypothetical protein NFI96_003891 [Prochilodus magdalenae]|nr:hypothetical protein NFI96_003891 [Prochilodus magdalenae]
MVKRCLLSNLKLHNDKKQPTMNINHTGFFPSLYDPPHAVGDIWGSMVSNGGRAPSLLEPQPWPETSRLLVAEYQPLEFYSPPPGGAAEPWGELDDICELNIRLKEIELLDQLAEEKTDHKRRNEL